MTKLLIQDDIHGFIGEIDLAKFDLVFGYERDALVEVIHRVEADWASEGKLTFPTQADSIEPGQVYSDPCGTPWRVTGRGISPKYWALDPVSKTLYVPEFRLRSGEYTRRPILEDS